MGEVLPFVLLELVSPALARGGLVERPRRSVGVPLGARVSPGTPPIGATHDTPPLTCGNVLMCHGFEGCE